MFQQRNAWKKSFWQRLTWRSALMFAAAAFVLAYPIYSVLEAAITHGIHQQGDLLVVDLKALSDFNLDQATGADKDIPPAYRALDRKRVMLAGEMWVPGSSAQAVDRFQLVYSIANCCFGGPPRVQCFVHATALPGHDLKFSQGVVNVIGTLHVGVEKGDGQIASVYRMDVEKIEN
jgi:hypothetical protein